MRIDYKIGEKFLTAFDWSFKDLLIPKGTLFEIIEKVDSEEYKVYFHCKDNEDHMECIQILDIEELNEVCLPTKIQ